MLHNKLHYNTEGAVCGLYTFSQMNFVPETEDICMVIIHDLTNDREIEAQEEQTLASVCPSVSGETAWPVAGAYYHDEFVGLQEKVGAGGAVRWVPLNSLAGNQALVRSCILLLVCAVADVFPGGTVKVRHALRKALYCELNTGRTLTGADVVRIKARMNELVKDKEPIELIGSVEKTVSETCRKLYGERDAEQAGHVVAGNIAVYRCGDVTDCYMGPLLPDMGYITRFNLRLYGSGVILETPEPEDPQTLPVYKDIPKMAQLFLEAEEWGRIVHCEYAADLNRHIAEGTVHTVIDMSEALQTEKIRAVADTVFFRRPSFKVVLIAGPSSSGKTTFCKRLQAYLRAAGLKPLALSLDDYFFNREDTPRNPDGSYDFESLRAVDIELFNKQIHELHQGLPVHLARFDFMTGKRCYDKDATLMPAGGLVMVEGLHALNDSLTYMLPRDEKFKISLGVLTQIRINDHNRIPTADTRIIRRMIRDYRFRNCGPERTLDIWHAVRQGEEINIYPYQEDADVLFNTALPYELSAMKSYAEPLLTTVKAQSPYYAEVKRLLHVLGSFRPIESNLVPRNSILREFIGTQSDGRSE